MPLDSVCISHSKDVDGLASAALVRRARGSEVLLADYGDLIQKLQEVGNVKELYVCDLGMNPQIAPSFLDELDRLGYASVTYIDHHPLTIEMKKEIESRGVKLIHSVEECAGVLTYMSLKDSLPEEAFLLACYAAVTDYLDTQPAAKALIQRFDRQFILLESTMLSYALARRHSDQGYLKMIVDRLSTMEYPHRIEGVQRYAAEQAEVISCLASVIRKEGEMLQSFAHVKTDENSTGLVSNLLFGAFDTKVAFAYKVEEDGVIEGSLRAAFDYGKHLGSIAQSLAEKMGGSGGGHARAAGVRFPASRLQEFLHSLDKELRR